MRYHYKARNLSGVLVDGSVNAESREDAVKKVLREGLSPLEIEADVRQGRAPVGLGSGKGRTSLSDLAEFLRRLTDLVGAEIPLVRALQMIEKRIFREELKNAVGRILTRLQDGISFSSAVAAEPGIFPSFWPGLIRAGEISGKLKDVLDRLTSLVEKERETRARLISGAVYPLLILTAGILIVIFMMAFVVPKLGDVFVDMGQDLPLITKILLGVSDAISRFWWLFGLALGVAFFGLRSYARSESGRVMIEGVISGIPFIGDFVRMDDMERLSRTIGILLESGVETVTALECSAQSLRSDNLKKHMASVVNAVRQGASLSSAFAAPGVFSEDVVGMIGIGEESGRGYRGFYQWADITDRQLEMMSKTATSLLEPALILFIGLIFGVIVMAMLLPIFNMNLGVQ